MSQNVRVDASGRWASRLILVKKRARGITSVHSGLVISILELRKCTQMFSWMQLLPASAEVAQMPLFNRIHVRSEIHLAELPFLLVMLAEHFYIFHFNIQLYVYRAMNVY